MNTKTAQTSMYTPSDPRFRYRRYPFYWCARVGNRYVQKMEARLKPLGLTITGWRICMILREQSQLSVSEISAHSAVKLSTVTKTVYAMEKKGYLAIRPRKNDARVSEVSITRSGLALIDTVIDQTAYIPERALEGFETKELDMLNDLLKRLFDNLTKA